MTTRADTRDVTDHRLDDCRHAQSARGWQPLTSRGLIGVRQVSARRARWERWSGPIRCWFRNRWNWRQARRARAERRDLYALAVPLVRLQPHEDPLVQRAAEVLESLDFSVVLHHGYGMGEALIEAYRHDASVLRPLIARTSNFTDAQLVGTPGVAGADAAVLARNDLLAAVRAIVATYPKVS